MDTSVASEESNRKPASITTDGDQGQIIESHSAVAQNMNNQMLECHMTVFLEQYGAYAVGEEVLAACTSYLRHGGHLTADNTWTAFQITPCDILKATDNSGYEPLGPIVDAIFAFCSTTGERGNDYIFKIIPPEKLNPSLGEKHMTYASLVEEDQAEGAWPNHKMITPMAAKEMDAYENVEEVRKHIVGDCYHILRDDPRRIFIYGMTLVDGRMNIWYFSRSHSVKTFSFDWMQGEGLYFFIQFMISLAMASPAALGVDPTVYKAPKPQSRRQQYVYEIDAPVTGVAPGPNSKAKLYFKTIRSLHQDRSLCITGRMTRVWVAQQVEDAQATCFVPGSEEVVLKDVWIDSKDPPETKNLEDIFNAVDKFVEDAQKKPGGVKKLIDDLYPYPTHQFKIDYDDAKARLVNLLTDNNYRRLFLTILYTWEGQQTKEIPSKGMSTPLRQVFSADAYSVAVGSSAPEWSANSSQQTPDSRFPSAKLPHSYAQKTQRRFVYKEVCTTSYDLPTLGDALDIIRQVLDASQILYCAGRVHRDISVGNILAVKHTVNGIDHFSVKLSDFEFAQKTNTNKHHTDPRTGTLHFMPVEIMNGHYLVERIRERKHSATQVSLPNGNATKPKRKLATRGQDPATEDPVKNAWGITPDHPLYETLNGFTPFKDLLPVPDNATPDIPAQGKGVNHNYQHDLESIWWIIVYFITTLVNHKDSHDLATKWFSYCNDTTASRMLLFMLELDSSFDNALLPELKDAFPDSLNLMRKTLHDDYIYKEVYGLLGDDRTYTFAFMEMARHVDFILDTRGDNWGTLKIKRYDP